MSLPILHRSSSIFVGSVSAIVVHFLLEYLCSILTISPASRCHGAPRQSHYEAALPPDRFGRRFDAGAHGKDDPRSPNRQDNHSSYAPLSASIVHVCQFILSFFTSCLFSSCTSQMVSSLSMCLNPSNLLFAVLLDLTLPRVFLPYSLLPTPPSPLII